MWIFKVGKFEYIDIWQVLSKKNGRLFGIVVKFEKKKKLLERNDKGQGKKCDHWNQNLKITVGKKMTVGEPKKMWPFESCQVLKKVTIRKK